MSINVICAGNRVQSVSIKLNCRSQQTVNCNKKLLIDDRITVYGPGCEILTIYFRQQWHYFPTPPSTINFQHLIVSSKKRLNQFTPATQDSTTQDSSYLVSSNPYIRRWFVVLLFSSSIPPVSCSFYMVIMPRKMYILLQVCSNMPFCSCLNGDYAENFTYYAFGMLHKYFITVFMLTLISEGLL